MQRIKGGYYIKARKIQESEIMKKPPYMRDIWDYLIREANHKTKIVYGRIIKRGQLFRNFKQIINGLSWHIGYRKESYNKWQCEKTMKYLRQRGMIVTTRTTRGLLITVCNYDFYQNPKNYESNTNATTKATREQLITDSINKNVLKNDKNRINITATEVRNWFDKFWEQYPRKLYKKDTMPVFFEKIRDDRDWEKVQVALTNYNKSKDVEDGTIMNAYNWLDSYEDWIDYREPKKKSSKLKVEDL